MFGPRCQRRSLSAMRMFAVLACFSLGAPALGEDAKAKQPASALEQEKAKGKEYLEKAAKEQGAVKTKSGMVYVPLKQGTGQKPWASNTVRVHYSGKLVDGKVFDASDPKQPIEFPLQGVIACWTEGLQQMKVGGKAKLVCPPELAYGDQAVGNGLIPAGSTLVFEVELLAVVK